MKILKDLMEQAGELPELKLFSRDDKGIPQPTGACEVTLLESSQVIEAINPKTKAMRYEVELHVMDGEIEKTYNFPVKAEDDEGNPTNTLHYLVKRLADFEYGAKVILEGKKERGTTYIAVREA